MTFKQRALSLALAAVGALALTACSPIRVSDEETGCPPAHVHLDVHGAITNALGDELDDRPYVLTVAAQSYDPEYQGIYIVGTGVSGKNPVVRDKVTDTDPETEEPVLCIPAERAVAVMVRMSMQNPLTAGEIVECALINRGVDGIGATGQVASDSREVELTDLIPPGTEWYVAQCDWLYVPPGFSGQLPDLFPRPEDDH